MNKCHPIDSLYTVESVKDTVPVIERIFGTKLCEIMVNILHIFVLAVLFLCHCFQLITLVHVLVLSYGRQTA